MPDREPVTRSAASAWVRSCAFAIGAGLLLVGGCAAQPAADAHRTPGQDAAANDRISPTAPPGTPAAAAAAAASAAAAAGRPDYGLADQADGYRMDADTDTPAETPGARYTFRILAPDGTPVTSFLPQRGHPMRVYAVSDDLRDVRYLTPAMDSDGTWSTGLGKLAPGGWRLYATFRPNGRPRSDGRPQLPAPVLSRPFTVAGAAASATLAPPTDTAVVDDSVLTLRGGLTAGRESGFTLDFAQRVLEQQGLGQVWRNEPLTGLQPYDGLSAEPVALRSGDGAFARIDPVDAGSGGPRLSFRGWFPEPGDWRMFIRFRVNGGERTAALTLRVNSAG